MTLKEMIDKELCEKFMEDASFLYIGDAARLNRLAEHVADPKKRPEIEKALHMMDYNLELLKHTYEEIERRRVTPRVVAE